MRNLRFLVWFGSLALLAAAVCVAGPTLPSAADAITPNSIAHNHGGVVTNYGPGVDYPKSITSGPDGALWFTNGDNSIGRITTSGVVTVYRSHDIRDPQGIVAGPDGALWFTNYGGDSIGRITTSGAVTDYTNPAIDHPLDITSGPDGALWFTNLGNDSIGRMSSGVVTNYTGTGIDDPQGITAGPDGALWFTNPATTRSGASPRPASSRTTSSRDRTTHAPSRWAPTGRSGSAASQ